MKEGHEEHIRRDWKAGGEEVERVCQKKNEEESGEMRCSRKKEKWLHWLGTEVAVEYKACLYFFVIHFYYSIYQVTGEIYTVSLVHMMEMIFATYGMGYLQVLALDNFDEAEHFRRKELALSLLCAALYTAVSYLLEWFDREVLATGGFFIYCMAAYGCAYLANKWKRYVDTKRLNAMLRAYQKGEKKE
nr:DUF3021 family protein [uncultured Acetatifactor sp.]